MNEEKWIVDWALLHPNRFPNWEAVGYRLQEFPSLSTEQKLKILQICRMWDAEKNPLPKAAVDPIIVTRHAGLVAWLAARGITGDVISHVTSPDQVSGRVVYGVLPLHLAAEAEEVVVVDMPRLPAELRGVDLTPEQMEEAGATLARYRVERL
jgi:putative CRISPR-associated protein (TIGR02620 family)